MLDVNLTGVWKTVKAAAPTMIERGRPKPTTTLKLRTSSSKPTPS
jgi:hypothetical protein